MKTPPTNWIDRPAMAAPHPLPGNSRLWRLKRTQNRSI